MDKVTGTVPTNHSLFEEKGEPKRYRTEVLPLTSLPPYPLGQTGSLFLSTHVFPLYVEVEPDNQLCTPAGDLDQHHCMEERG